MRLEAFVQAQLSDVSRIDRITARAKNIERFVAKAAKETDRKPKYDDPHHQIQDQLGVRVLTFYLTDIDRVSAEAKTYFTSVEDKLIVPDSEREFDYVAESVSRLRISAGYGAAYIHEACKYSEAYTRTRKIG